MAVTLTFKSGKTRDFPEATGAFKRGPAMYVTKDGDEVWRGDSTEVVSATVTLDTGQTVTEPGGAKSSN